MNAASWALMLTGRLVEWHDADGGAEAVMRRLVARAGEPVVRVALRQAMKVMADQFVMGRGRSPRRSREAARATPRAIAISYDMLGEAAMTAADAQRYLAAYADAIAAIGASVMARDVDVFAQPIDLGQAVGAAPALRIRAARPRAGRARARARGSRPPRGASLASA